MAGRPCITASGYKLLAQSLGRTVAYLEQSMTHATDGGGPAVQTVINALVADLRQDNSRFDEGRFRAMLDMTRRAEYPNGD